MKTFTILTIYSLLAFPVFSAGQPPSQDIPDPSVTFIGPHPPLANLKELWDKTSVVVLATVQNSLSPQVEDGRIVTRFQIFDIREVLKDERNLLASVRRIRVKQYGGTVSVGGRDIVTNFIADPLPVGAEAILFLSSLEAANTYEIPYGATGTFPVDRATGAVSIGASASRMPELRGRRTINKDELIAKLRALTATR